MRPEQMKCFIYLFLFIYAKCRWKINGIIQFSYFIYFYLAKDKSKGIIIKKHFNKNPAKTKIGPTGDICAINAGAYRVKTIYSSTIEQSFPN